MTRGHPSSVNDTLRAVWWLAELGMIESPAASRAFGYLFATQKEDGGWDENPVATIGALNALKQYDLLDI